MYAPAQWSIHDVTILSGDRTINHCEGWNNAFNKLVGHSHPSVWRLITHLKEDESMMCTMILQENRIEPPTKRIRKATKDLQKKLLYCIVYLYSAQYLHILQDSKRYLTNPTIQVQPQLTSN